MSSKGNVFGVLHIYIYMETSKIKTMHNTFGSYLGMITWVIYGMVS